MLLKEGRVYAGHQKLGCMLLEEREPRLESCLTYYHKVIGKASLNPPHLSYGDTFHQQGKPTDL